MIAKKKRAYIKKYLNIKESKIIENKDILEGLLFYKHQYEKQHFLENNPKILFKSDARLFGLNMDIIKPIYNYLNCKPKTKIKWPKNKKFAVFLSHDIDLIFPSWKYRYYISFKLFLNLKLKKAYNIFTKKYNPYNNFEKIVKLEKKYNAKSTFFFLLPDRDPVRVNYTKEDIIEIVKFLDRKGQEIGLHGGFYSYDKLNEIKKEKRRLEKILGKNVIGYRNHFLRFKIPTTWKVLEELGFVYDSTFGYNDMVGFRNGLCFPFKPWDAKKDKEINIFELPLNIMDCTLFNYMKLNMDTSFKICKKLIDCVKFYGGVLTLNWHNTSFDGIYYRNYERLYMKILDYCNKNNGWLTSGREIVEYYKEIL